MTGGCCPSDSRLQGDPERRHLRSRLRPLSAAEAPPTGTEGDAGPTACSLRGRPALRIRNPDPKRGWL